MIDVTDRMVAGAMNAARRGDDPLGIGDGDTYYAMNMLGNALDGADAETAARFADACHKLIGASRNLGNPRGECVLDPLMAKLLANAGVDPLVIAWLAFNGIDVALDDDEDGRVYGWIDATHPAGSEWTTSRIALPGAIWEQKGTLLTFPIPETTAAVITGRPLRDVATHLVLDDEDLSITDVTVIAPTDKFETGTSVITTDHRSRPCDIATLVAAAPFGCR